MLPALTETQGVKYLIIQQYKRTFCLFTRLLLAVQPSFIQIYTLSIRNKETEINSNWRHTCWGQHPEHTKKETKTQTTVFKTMVLWSMLSTLPCLHYTTVHTSACTGQLSLSALFVWPQSFKQNTPGQQYAESQSCLRRPPNRTSCVFVILFM